MPGIRPIARLYVQETGRQVEAREVATGRALAGWIGLLGTVLALVSFQAGARGPAGAVSLILFAVMFLHARPWHRTLRVDVDTRTCVVQSWILGVLPFWRRTFGMEARAFGVRLRQERQEGGGEAVARGCLAALLPFPFSLVLMGGGDKEETVLVRIGLCLLGRGRADEVVPLAAADVAEEFLAAVRRILPDHVTGTVTVA